MIEKNSMLRYLLLLFLLALALYGLLGDYGAIQADPAIRERVEREAEEARRN